MPRSILSTGDRTIVRVNARNPWNDAGLDVEKGDRLAFAAAGQWCDAFYRSGAEGYRAPVWMRPADRLRRSAQGEWFELTGAIGRAESVVFRIGLHGRVTMPAAGHLYLFANDVPGFYWNNFGHLTVTITPDQG